MIQDILILDESNYENWEHILCRTIYKKSIHIYVNMDNKANINIYINMSCHILYTVNNSIYHLSVNED